MSSEAIGLYALASHAAGDFPLQTDRMASKKFDSPSVRASHVAVYTISFLPVVFAADWNQKASAAFLLSIFGSHFVIDTRRWKENTDEFPTFSIWFDQALHLIALALSMALASKISK